MTGIFESIKNAEQHVEHIGHEITHASSEYAMKLAHEMFGGTSMAYNTVGNESKIAEAVSGLSKASSAHLG